MREAFPLQMDDFDRQLETELARMLDRVVRTPAPPRRGRASKPLLNLLAGFEASIGPVATVVVVADSPAELKAELPASFSEAPAAHGPAIFS